MLTYASAGSPGEWEVVVTGHSPGGDLFTTCVLILLYVCPHNPICVCSGEWEVVVTGHSLGGALATLAAAELAQAVDVSRGFKTRKVDSWFTSIARVVMQVP
jgi:hypothetical protein